MSPAIPLFPLDNVVLFPKVQVPLYIFEPRYRQMTAAALESDGRIGMVVVQPQGRPEMSGDPPVFEIGCLGEIGHADENEDGTYHIVLQGSTRFRIRDEIPRDGSRLYRLAEVDLLEESEPEAAAGAMPKLRDRVLEMMRRVAPDRAGQFNASNFEKLDDATFVNAFCQSLDFETLEKQQLIEANSVLTRAEQLVALMEFRLAAQASAGPSGSDSIH